MRRTFDGRKMLAILVAGFGVVVSVNLYAAVAAKRTFGGIVVDNSYVASQNYNGWLREAARQRALGWSVEPKRLPDGRVAINPSGVPAGAKITGEARHPLGRQPDIDLDFDNKHVSTAPLPAGRWTLRITVRADGKLLREESEIR